MAAALKRISFTPIQILVHLTAWALVAWLVYDYFTGHLTINPIQAATQRLGKYALIFLTLTLANHTDQHRLWVTDRYSRRAGRWGCIATFFAAAHFLMFVGVDYHFNFGLLLADIASKKYVWVGIPAFLILTALAITSTNGWKRRLRKNWKRLHRLVYAAGVLVILHYAWAKKGDLFSLRGDIQQPLAFGLLILILLLLRIPADPQMGDRPARPLQVSGLISSRPLNDVKCASRSGRLTLWSLSGRLASRGRSARRCRCTSSASSGMIATPRRPFFSTNTPSTCQSGLSLQINHGPVAAGEAFGLGDGGADRFGAAHPFQQSLLVQRDIFRSGAGAAAGAPPGPGSGAAGW